MGQEVRFPADKKSMVLIILILALSFTISNYIIFVMAGEENVRSVMRAVDPKDGNEGGGGSSRQHILTLEEPTVEYRDGPECCPCPEKAPADLKLQPWMRQN